MPRFFFHVRDDVDAPDPEGLVLADAEKALQEALRGARAIAAAQVLEGHLHLSHRIEVEDESGATIATITFRDAVAVDG
jgi:DNA primase